MRSLREACGMSQVKLAEEMAARGWPWHQQTVTRVETGRRMVRWGEVLAAADILGVTTDRFRWETAEGHGVHQAAEATARLYEAFRLASDGILRLHAARSVAGKRLAEARGSRYQRVRDAAEELAGMLGQTTLEYAAGDAKARFEHPEDEEGALWPILRTAGSRSSRARTVSRSGGELTCRRSSSESVPRR